MSLQHDWLLPLPRSTPGDVAAYWPDTGFTVVPEIGLSDKQLDVLEKPETNDIPAEFSEYAAIASHEQTHWIQAHAFSYGRFQSRIDHACSEIAESFFGLFTPEQIDFLIRRRLEGQPILLVSDRHTVVRRRELGPIGVALQQHWWGLRLLGHELEMSDRHLGRLQSTRFRFGLAVLYAKAGPYISKVAMLPKRILRDEALEHAPREGYGSALARCGYPELSSRAIAECAAVLNQHWLYAYATASYKRQGAREAEARLRATHVRSWESKEMTLYGDAFRAFAFFNPHLDLNEARPLLTLLVICCLSLDGTFEPETRFTRSWLDVSPPLRFMRLVKSIRRVGLVRVDRLSELSPAQYRKYCDDLCEVAGISIHKYFQRSLPVDQYEASPINDLKQLLHDAACCAFELRRTLPAALVAPTETAVYYATELNESPLNAYSLARLPPMLSVGGRAKPVGISPARFSLCAVGGAYQRILWQLFAGTKVSFEGLPTCEIGRACVTKAVSLLRERTQRPISIEQ